MHRTTRSRTCRLLTVLAALALVGGGAASAGATTPAPAATAGPRIVGGTPAAPGAWPAQVALLSASVDDPVDAQLCGGTLVAARWVLTAGHCVAGAATSDLQVAAHRSRLHDIGADDRIAITKIVAHPGFGSSGDIALKNDVALVRLARAVPGPYAQLVGPQQDGSWGPGTVATVTGWGTMTPGVLDGSDTLRQVDVRVISDERCAKAYPGIDGRTNVCAGWMAAGGRDACQGDSGGPLWARIGGTWRQVGIVSSGDGCAEPGHPGTYADVRGLRSWIDRQLG